MMRECTYSDFQAFCQKTRKQCPYAAFDREEAWEKGVGAVASKVHDLYRSGGSFGPAEREAFYQKKAKQYQGKYKETYLEAIRLCLSRFDKL